MVYIIVTPSPIAFPGGATDGAGISQVFIKFGDADPFNFNRYTPNNPSFAPTINPNFDGGSFYPSINGGNVQLGRYLQQQIFQGGQGQAPLVPVPGNTVEWFNFTPLPGVNIAALQAALANFCNQFLNHDFRGTPAQNAVANANAFATNIVFNVLAGVVF